MEDEIKIIEQNVKEAHEVFYVAAINLINAITQERNYYKNKILNNERN